MQFYSLGMRGTQHLSLPPAVLFLDFPCKLCTGLARSVWWGTGWTWQGAVWVCVFIVQSLSQVWLFATAACQASLSFTLSPGACLNSCPLSWWCYPTILSSVAPFSSFSQSFWGSGSFPVSVLCIRWPKYWSFSFSISPSSEYPELISFRIDWLDLLAVQGTFKNLLQHHSPKASILHCSVFLMVQLSRPYMTIRKIIALAVWTFVSKVMSLLFNMLSRFVTAFLPRSQCLLI